jgi:hypothetical protein
MPAAGSRSARVEGPRPPLAGLTSTATRAAAGTNSRRRPSRFVFTSTEKKLIVRLAAKVQDGRDGRGFNVRGTWDQNTRYFALDVVATGGSSFAARRDDPGPCPGDGWQLIAAQGKRGTRGEPGERGLPGPCGRDAPSICDWSLDPERYRATPVLADGTLGPVLELRTLFERFMADTSE